MTEVEIDQQLTLNKLIKLNPNKSRGPDGFYPMLLKEIAPLIAWPLVDIFSMALILKIIPDDWCMANFIPIFKKGDKSRPENYCPISLTSVLTKIIKGIVSDCCQTSW